MANAEAQEPKSQGDEDKGFRWSVLTQVAAALAVIVGAMWASPTLRDRIEGELRRWFPATLMVEVVQPDLFVIEPKALGQLRFSVASSSSVIESAISPSNDSLVKLLISDAGSEKDRVVVLRDTRRSTCSDEFDSTKAKPGVVKCVLSVPVLLNLGLTEQSKPAFPSASKQAKEAKSLLDGQYEKGYRLYMAKQFDAALPYLKEAASNGNRDAMYNLGFMSLVSKLANRAEG